jgi:hypothetical protein
MKTIELNKKLSRPMDRKKLGLKPMYKSESESESETEGEGQIEGESEGERMKKLINKWWNADTKTGKILKFVYDSETGVSEMELKEFIKSTGSNDVKKMYHHLTTKTKEYKLVFERTSNEITKIKNEAREYIKNKM